MSKDNSRARSTDLHETCQAVPAPSRRGLLAGAGLDGGAMAQLFVTEAIAAGASATVERLKRPERDPAHSVLLTTSAFGLSRRLSTVPTHRVLTPNDTAPSPSRRVR